MVRPVFGVVFDFAGVGLACSCCNRRAPKLKKGAQIDIPLTYSSIWVSFPCV